MELIRQPIFLILLTSSCAFIVFLSSIYYFAFGEDPKLVADSVLAVIFLTGLFATVVMASASVAQELRSGTALAVLAKPVGRARFLIAKYVGVIGALTLMVFANLIAALLASRVSFDVYGEADLRVLGVYYGAIVLAFAGGGFTNYFLGRSFVSDAVLFLIATTLLAFASIELFIDTSEWFTGGKEIKGVDWRMIPAVSLLMLALWLLAGIAIACSTRLDMIPTLAVCTGFFLLGLMSDYLFGRAAAEGNWIASVLYTITPNWQLFWLADALENHKTIPWSYVGKALTYVVGYLGAALATALIMFEDRELS